MADVLSPVSSASIKPKVCFAILSDSPTINPPKVDEADNVQSTKAAADPDLGENSTPIDGVAAVATLSSSSPRSSAIPRLLSSSNSPRYEAFVMTGEKILRLNPKISPMYAQVKQSELPEHTEVLDSSPTRGPFTDLENNFHNRRCRKGNERKRHMQNGTFDDDGVESFLCKISASQSENVLTQSENGYTTASGDAEEEDNIFNFDKNASSITVQGTFPYVEKAVSKVCSVHTVHSDYQYESGLIDDISAPPSPVFFSEPSTPAKHLLKENVEQEDRLKSHLEEEEELRSSLVEDEGRSRSLKESAATTNISQELSAEELEIFALEKNVDNCTEVTVSPSGCEEDCSRKNSSSAASLALSSSSVVSTPLKEKLQQLSSKQFQQQQLNENDADAAKRLAKRLYNLEGFKKSDVAKHLAKNNEFGNMVSVEYLSLFDCGGMKLDEAIRNLLSHFCLTGETSERERILWFFSRRYFECNAANFNSEDEVHTLTCALLLLNTDLHGKNVTKRMSCNDFIDNIAQTGYKYPRSVLKSYFQAIKQNPIEWAENAADLKYAARRPSSNSFCYVELPDPESQIVHKKGWVMRKCVVESDGKKTPYGRRGWRMFYATLKGVVLYLHQDENGFKKGSFLTFRNSIRLYHAFAMKANDYTKKLNVFRLQTASYAEYLFQASNTTEMEEWMNEINFVAARLSSPSLPSSVSSQRSASLSRHPSLPMTRTKLSAKEQLKNHESRIEDLQKQLSDNRKYLPSRSAKSKVIQNYAEHEIYLLLEFERYSTYVQLLQNRLVSSRRGSATLATGLLADLVEHSTEDLHNNNNCTTRGDCNTKPLEVEQHSENDALNRNSYGAAISSNVTQYFETNF